jgi:glycosyltransferase involved in cell wall biosynthesis
MPPTLKRIVGGVKRRAAGAVRTLHMAVRDQAPARYRHTSLAIFDDCFPNLLSPFRVNEYSAYLKQLPSAAVHSTANVFGTGHRFYQFRQEYAAAYPELAARVLRFRPGSSVRAATAYTVFINNVSDFLPTIERLGIPFAFTLYPGGGLSFTDAGCRQKLQAAFGSKWFRKVIVTQPATRRFLVAEQLCETDAIEYVFGGVFRGGSVDFSRIERRRFQLNKDTLDICFVAHKYTPQGRDKGYDLFIEVARRVLIRHPYARFHVVGGYTRDDIEATDLNSAISYYGTQPPAFFPAFYAGMDLIIAPNRPNILMAGGFDGFPVGCSIEAALAGVGVMCTDPLDQNEGVFASGRELEIVQPDSDQIANLVTSYAGSPDKLAALGAAGCARFAEVYNFEAQMAPRFKVINGLKQ